ncbi:MAG: hypothetical protein CVU05_01105 [Bacteroidetes bacterium HGW-Bacteroidetes-21]|jgi:hypothetical protein|nr:MAG: hypothetical protein CVU05_01105 [Bacteroidetes bacterium HGW-Bacteroidetes-21]
MKNLLFLLVLIGSISAGYSQNTYVAPSKHYFAVSLQASPEDLITFAIISLNEAGDRQVTYLSRRSFIRQMIGLEYSMANPEETNLLKDAGIDGPEVFDNLWKLRYSENPYKSESISEGWSRNRYSPSPEQLTMLNAFGISKLSDFSYGNNLIELFKAMNSDQWVAEYFGK